MAISVDPRDKSDELTKKLGLSFPLHGDPDRAVARAWGVADPKRDIALPATFVVAKGGRIVFRHIGANPKDRPTMQAILAALG